MRGLQELHAHRLPRYLHEGGKAHVDNTLCVGCGVCEQMCAFGAFQSTRRRLSHEDQEYHDRRRGRTGSLLASKLLGHLLMEQGYDVKVSEVHGMSQRAAAWSPMCATAIG